MPNYTSLYNENNLETLQDEVDANIRVGTGVIHGGTLSINAGDNTLFDISAGGAVFVDLDDNIQTNITWTAKTGLTPTYLASNLISWVGLAVDGTVYQADHPLTEAERREFVDLGALVHVNKTYLDNINNEHYPADHVVNQLHDLMDVIGFLNTAGNLFSASASDLTMNKSDGYIFKTGSNYFEDEHSPHIHNTPALSPAQFQYRFSNATNYTGLTQGTIIPGFYEVSGSGVATAMSNANPFSVQRIYIFTSDNVKIQFGQKVYKTLADAEAGITTESFTTEPSLAANGLFRAYLCIRYDCTDLSNTSEALFIHAGKFGDSSAGAIGGTTTLQQAYENSGVEHITTNAVGGAFELQAGVLDTDDVFDCENLAGAITASITGAGDLTCNTIETEHINITTGLEAAAVDTTFGTQDTRVGALIRDVDATGAKHSIGLQVYDITADGLNYETYGMTASNIYNTNGGATGLYIADVAANTNTSSASGSDAFGLRINNVTNSGTSSGAHSYGIHIGAVGSTSGDEYGIYVATNVPSRFVGQIQAQNGSAIAPSLTFTNSLSTGIYRYSADVIGFSCGGSGQMTMSTSQTTTSNNITPSANNTYTLGKASYGFKNLYVNGGTSGVPSICFENDTDTGLYRSGTNAIGITAGGTSMMILSGQTNTITTTKRIGIPSGSVGSPSLYFTANSDCGLYYTSNNVVTAVQGATILNVASSIVICYKTFRASNDNTYDLGTSGQRWDDVYATNGSIITSDERLKKDITDGVLGLDFINKLRPVSFVWKDTITTDEDTGIETTKTHTRPHLGLIAQETEAAMNECGQTISDNDILCNDYLAAGGEDPDALDRYGMRYSALISPLILAVQQLTAKVESLETQINILNG
jgi:hypothetical protein